MLNPRKFSDGKTTPQQLWQKWEELREEQSKIAQKMDDFIGTSTERFLIKSWRERDNEMKKLEDRYDRLKKERYTLDQIIETSERILNWLKTARGKPGRHPKPFNVLVYHLINKRTKRKVDENRNPVYHKDGQHKLERDWKLILFLILDIHLHRKELPELRKFISENKNKSAHKALRALKEKLWNTYKNFPPLEGWPFPRKAYETGFRKLIVADDGRLHIVSL